MTQPEIDTQNSPAYLSHYNMHRPPFSNTLENDMFYAEPTLTQRLDLALHLLQYGDELLMVIAEEGGGKTQMMNQLVYSAHSSWRLCVITANESMNTDNLIKQLRRRFKIPEVASKTGNMLNTIKWQLEDLLTINQTVVIIVDDAHKLEWQILSVLFDLSTIVNQKNSVSLRVILFCDPHIRETLSRPELEKQRYYKQRKIELSPLDESQTAKLIQHRMAVAGVENDSVFSESIIHKIFTFSEGNPAEICAAAHQVLVEACPRLKNRLFAWGNGLPKLQKKGLLRILASVVIVAVISALLFFQDEINQLYKTTSPSQDQWPSKNQVSQHLPIPKLGDIKTLPANGAPKSQSPTTEDDNDRHAEQAQSATTQTITTESVIAGSPGNAPDQVLPADSEPTSPPIPQHSLPRDKNSDVENPADEKPSAEEPQKKQIKPASRPSTSISIKYREDWLLAQKANYYTLQLVAGYKPETISKFIQQHHLHKSKIAYYLSNNKGEAWHSLVYGVYPNRKAAQNASKNLPNSLKKIRPWIRQLKTIQKEIKADKR